MTPEQKAHELTQKITNALFDNGCSINKQGVFAASIVAIDEILKNKGTEQENNPIFWFEVKQEIEKR